MSVVLRAFSFKAPSAGLMPTLFSKICFPCGPGGYLTVHFVCSFNSL